MVALPAEEAGVERRLRRGDADCARRRLRTLDPSMPRSAGARSARTQALSKRTPTFRDRRSRSHRDFMITLRELGVSANRNAIEQKAVEAAKAVFGSAHRVPVHESRLVRCGHGRGLALARR